MSAAPHHFNSTIRPQGASGRSSGTGAVTPSMPQHVAGDILLLIVESAGQAISLTTANGFVEVPGSPVDEPAAGLSTATRLAVYWCRATSAAMASPVVADSGDHQISDILVFRGCKATGNPWNVIATGTESTSTNVVAVPGATTTVDNCLVVAIATTSADADLLDGSFGAWSNTSLTSFHEIEDYQTSQGNGGGIGVAIGVKATAGAYSTTLAALTSGLSRMAFMSIALEPEAPPVVDTTAPTFSLITPTNLSELTRFQPITFRVTDDTEIADVYIWVKYASDRYRTLVSDGSALCYPFLELSTRLVTGITQLDYSILPEGGWRDAIEEFEVIAYDAAGNKSA